jgi:uncharacterized membrane protein YkvA (DUF1232 family)
MNDPIPRREESVYEEFKQILPRLPKYAKLVWLLLKDPSLSARQRAALMGAVGYSISPIDAFPGQLDDLVIVLLTVRWILGSLPKAKADEYLTGAGLTAGVVEGDFQLAKRSGKRILRRVTKTLGLGAVFVLAFGKSLVSRRDNH